MDDPYLLPMMTTTDVRDHRVALLPVGSFEQHGPGLPLATDTVIACTVAREIAARHAVLPLPPITISCSHEHAAWPGTVSISAATLYAVVRDVAASLRAAGTSALVLINGHGGNHVLLNAVQEAGGSLALFPDLRDWAQARAAAGLATGNDEDMHAGELETSILLHAHPALVRPDPADSPADPRRFLTRGLAPYTASGVVGHPTLATPAKGRAVLAHLTGTFADCLAALSPPAP